MMNDNSKPYFLYSGLAEVSRDLKGNENIYLGIRPYGFHAGNNIPFVIYPYLLCSKLLKQEKTPEFNFHVFINDWEQDDFDKTIANIHEYPFNVVPQRTTFQFTSCHHDNSKNIVDHWENIILDGISVLQDSFPDITIKTVRNSQMLKDPIMKDVVIKTIKDPDLVGNVLRKATNREILDKPYAYCRAVCPDCNFARTENKIHSTDHVDIKCPDCGLEGIYEYESLNYWLYHKPLALPRIKAYNIDLCITGMDHYNEGDFVSRRMLFDVYGIDIKMPQMLYTPVLYGRNRKPMGKSKNNYETARFNELLDLVLKNPDSEKIFLG